MAFTLTLSQVTSPPPDSSMFSLFILPSSPGAPLTFLLPWSPGLDKATQLDSRSVSPFQTGLLHLVVCISKIFKSHSLWLPWSASCPIVRHLWLRGESSKYCQYDCHFRAEGEDMFLKDGCHILFIPESFLVCRPQTEYRLMNLLKLNKAAVSGTAHPAEPTSSGTRVLVSHPRVPRHFCCCLRQWNDWP